MSIQRRRQQQQQRQEKTLLDNTCNALSRMLYESKTGYLIDSSSSSSSINQQQQPIEAAIATAAAAAAAAKSSSSSSSSKPDQLLDSEFSKFLHSSQAAIAAKYITRNLDVKSMTLSIVRRTK